MQPTRAYTLLEKKAKVVDLKNIKQTRDVLFLTFPILSLFKLINSLYDFRNN